MSEHSFTFGSGQSQLFKKRKPLQNSSNGEAEPIISSSHYLSPHKTEEVYAVECINDFEVHQSADFEDILPPDIDGQDIYIQTTENFEEIPFDNGQDDDILKLSFEDYVVGALLLQGGLSKVNYI